MDGELDGPTLHQVGDHIEVCASCRALLDGFRKVDDLIRGLHGLDVKDDFARQVLEKVRESDRPPGLMCPGKGALSRVLSFLEPLWELFEAKRAPNTGILEEFDDFPPLSVGFIYFKFWSQVGRG